MRKLEHLGYALLSTLRMRSLEGKVSYSEEYPFQESPGRLTGGTIQ